MAYHAGMSVLDYAFASIITGGHGDILMAVEGYAESGYGAAERGLSPDAIQALAWTSTGSNVVTERLLGRAFRGSRGILGSVAEGSIGAGAEWYMTDMVDGFVSGDLSVEAATYRSFLAEGMSPEEAGEAAFQARKEEVLQSMAAGGVMSGMSWAGGRAIDKIRSVYTGGRGDSTPGMPEESCLLQEEGISEILDTERTGVAESGSNTGAGEYAAPSGGGGVTSTIKANGQTVNFGHGGRHLEGTGLNVDAVNQALANEVSTLNLGTGQFHKGQIIVDGITIEYTSYGVSEGIINVGTYYPLQ